MLRVLALPIATAVITVPSPNVVLAELAQQSPDSSPAQVAERVPGLQHPFHEVGSPREVAQWQVMEPIAQGERP